ncbi:MAG: METTL5 family protein [Candidatus Thermoplasmatota archaeon]|jgi:putative methylase|nr:METTL5 family protein [Candidatus Thermoplasmatota archaeon]
MRHAELVRALERVPPFDRARPELEQVATPAEAAALLLETAHSRGDLAGRSVLDLGCGTGRLAIGAAILGARPVVGVDIDAAPLAIARAAAREAGVEIDLRHEDVRSTDVRADTVVMNPPFGAQRRGADRPFWDRAFSLAGSAVYAFASAESRTFIARLAVEHAAHVDASRPVPWELPRVFGHHRRAKVRLDVDLWVLRTKVPS